MPITDSMPKTNISAAPRDFCLGFVVFGLCRWRLGIIGQLR